MTAVDLNLTGKIAIVTGASRRQGIGAAVCRMLARHGADVFFTHWLAYDRNQPFGDDPDGPDACVKDLEAASVRAAAAIDLANPDAPRKVLDAAGAALGPPSILVNNAVHSVKTDAMTLDATSLDAHYAVNVRALALLSTDFSR